MRTIKFRAWDKKNEQMIPDMENWLDFGGIYWTTPDKTFDTPNQEIYTPMSQPILMQFTGLTDKNGKEIYEGDVVMDGNKKREVMWLDEGAQFISADIPDKNNWDIMTSVECGGDYTVIGNIYEHPELLK